MGILVVAVLVVEAVSAIGTMGIIIIVFGLSVGIIFVVVADCPMD
jgi:hypothetical protein